MDDREGRKELWKLSGLPALFAFYEKKHTKMLIMAFSKIIPLPLLT